MIPDPATTPIKRSGQVVFGLAVAAIYGMLFVFHIVFGLFIALCATSAARGIILYIGAWSKRPALVTEPAELQRPTAQAAAN
jgi:enediyne biosynthesis protein E5